MRVSDMCSLPLAALWQQKTRTVLTTMGVIFGSFVLAASLSTDQGVQDAIGRELGEGEVLRRIQVRQQGGGATPHKVQVTGRMSDAQRERLRHALEGRRQQQEPEVPRTVLNQKMLRSLAALEHVERVVPTAWMFGSATVAGHSEATAAYGVRPDSSHYKSRLIAGRFFTDADENVAIINEFLAYRLGFVDEAAINRLVGKKLRFAIPFIHGYRPAAANGSRLALPTGAVLSGGQHAVLAQLARQLPALLANLAKNLPILDKLMKMVWTTGEDTLSREFTIVGITRLTNSEERDERWDPLNQDAEILLPLQTATDLHFQIPREAEQGIGATLIVDREDNIGGVLQKIEKLGLNGFAFREGIKRERLMYSLIFRTMTCIAAVALFVAALGIANTMLMSVLERTREIGVMKAVGAGNGHLQLIFLIEGSLIGLVGGGLGLLLAWGASIPGDMWVRAMVSRDIKIDLKGTLFVFPSWLTLTVMVFAVVVTTLAALYPARHAAKIDPVTALRHE